MDAKPTHCNSNSRRPRRGFTLVEMLVVVLIIGILAGLITAAAFKAMDRAKLTVIKLDCSQLDMAINAYKDKYGDYPPDFFFPVRDGLGYATDPLNDPAKNAVVRHFRKAFPRYIPGRPSGSSATNEWDKFRDDVIASYPLLSPPYPPPLPPYPNNYFDVNLLNPASAIVFCLGGMPAIDGSKTLVGFSANPENPFDQSPSRTEKLFEFDETRLVGFDEANVRWTDQKTILIVVPCWPTYVPEGISIKWPPPAMPDQNVPYVYFKARTDGTSGRVEYAYYDSSDMQPFFYQHPPLPGVANSICVPYLAGAADIPTLAATVRRWENPTSFQIIAPGLDANFGQSAFTVFRWSKIGTGLTEGDLDNVTNFSKGKLEDEIKP